MLITYGTGSESRRHDNRFYRLHRAANKGFVFDRPAQSTLECSDISIVSSASDLQKNSRESRYYIGLLPRHNKCRPALAFLRCCGFDARVSYIISSCYEVLDTLQEAGMSLAYGDYVDAPSAVRVAALAGLVALALSSVRLMDMLTVRAEESTKDRAQRLKQIQVRFEVYFNKKDVKTCL